MGVLSYAESCPLDCGFSDKRGFISVYRRGSPTLYVNDQLSGKVAKVSVAGEICFVPYGREVFDGGSAIH